VVLIETSAWIEYLRRTGSGVNLRVRELLDDAVTTCDPIRLEVLAGARDDALLRRLQGLLARASLLPTESEDYDQAASLYRACRRRGETVRSHVDCLIAAVAIRHDVELLHADRDFEVIARHSALRLAS
jgi:predicted nucleic acid-binding protein